MQIFLQGKLLGIEEFLLAPAAGTLDSDSLADYTDQVFLGRSHWVSLLCEVLPRALLAEMGLAKILLGSSGGGQFMVLLPEESRIDAEGLLRSAARDILHFSRGALRLVWSVTENLGDWSVIRKRLSDELERVKHAPGFSPEIDVQMAESDAYFAQVLGWNLRDATSVGWSPSSPGMILLGGGKHNWQLGRDQTNPDNIPFVRHTAQSDDGQTSKPASGSVLASRAKGMATWGVLRGDVDNFDIRIRRAQSIDEHLQFSVMFKQFFAGELEVQCSMPEYFRNVSVIYSGGDDFAVMGSWDSLIGLAGEMERLFHLFAGQNLKDFAGVEAKTITLALALAPSVDASLGAVFEEAGRRLEAAKAVANDSFWLLGRTLEWKQFSDAASLKKLLLRMVTEFGCSPQYLKDLCGMYRETQSRMSKRQARRSGGERPWRYHRRLNRILSAARTGARPNRIRGDFQKARAALIADLIGRSAVSVKLRPAGRVALEWARLSAET